MDFSGDDYFQAALQRMTDAQRMFESHHVSDSLVMYCAGLAAECMLRAFVSLHYREFDARHDFGRLLVKSRMRQLLEGQMESHPAQTAKIQMRMTRLHAAVNQIVAVWSNNIRFAADPLLRRHFNRRKMYRGVRGDLLRELSRRLLSAALEVVNQGVVLWSFARKSNGR